MKFKIKNWLSFQHYKDRNPPWIKLHFSLLSSSDWVILDDCSRVLAIACMLVASRSDGEIDGSDAGLSYMQRVAYLNKKPNLKPLIDCGFLECASDCKQMLADARPETETETETETKKKRASALPDWVPIDAWNGWIASRKKKPTPRAIQLAVAKLDALRAEGHSPQSVLDAATLGGWTGLYAPKESPKAQRLEVV